MRKEFKQCLKIAQKVAFNIAIEASYVYFFSEQKLIKSAKNSLFGEDLKNWRGGQTLLPDRSILIRQKLVENPKIQIFICYILSHFQTMCIHISYRQ